MRDPVLDDARLGQEDNIEALAATLAAKDDTIAALRGQVAVLKQRLAASITVVDGDGRPVVCDV